jgi:hypothetical protein
MKKFYLFLSVVLAMSGRQVVRAQDSSVCNATFQASVSGTVVSFRANDSLPGVQHNWNFGDGSAKNTDSFAVNHVYPAYGQYVVTQVVTDSTHHCRDSAAQLVIVPAPAPACSMYITEGVDTSHRVYSFIANPSFSPGAADTVRWTINDTLVAMGDTLQKYLPGGPYNVCALLTTSYSCQAQSCLTINPQDSVPTVPPPPPDTCTINFTAAPKDHKPNQYDFTVIDGKEYDSISWTIMGPDSLFAGPYHGPSFNYTFPDTGYYSVYVTADKRSGCAVSNGQYVHIDSIAGPSGHFINAYPNPTTTQVGLSVTLDEHTSVDVRVYNSMGGLVLSRTVSGYPGFNQITLPIANLPQGVYYVELQYGGTILRSKFQKL